ncbi:flagellar biosynthesis protein FliQ [Pseudomonas aeruginosa]|nr:flagellar biosynthesis protein FliQ [Pseudomonas aeruginosa]
MTPEVALDLFREALWLTAMIVGVLVVPSLLVGLVVAMFQAATQINEQTLSFLPRLMVILLTLIVLGPWLLRQLMEYTQTLIGNIPLLIAAVDVPYQIWDNRQKLLMTKQEVRDEYKDSEGKPEVKSKIRQMQREMAQRRMMAAVPEADVVITNPTHFAVALKYDPAGGGAPLLLAKGNDFLALKIREVAQEHKVMVMESPALARAVYYSTELDQEIPAGLYLAVAQVLAYVYQLKQYQAGKGKRPSPLKDLPIPPDLRRDE